MVGAGLEGMTGGATQAAQNLMYGPPWHEGVARQVAVGSIAGMAEESVEAGVERAYDPAPKNSGRKPGPGVDPDPTLAGLKRQNVPDPQIGRAIPDDSLHPVIAERLAAYATPETLGPISAWARAERNAALHRALTNSGGEPLALRRRLAEQSWRRLGRREGSRVDVTQDPNVRRLIEQGYGPSEGLLPKPRFRDVPPELAALYRESRLSNIPDRVTDAILQEGTAGRSVAISLKDIHGTLQMKRAAMHFDTLLPQKPSELAHLKSNDFGFVVNPRTGRVYISDPDIEVIVEHGGILSDRMALMRANEMNLAARGSDGPAYWSSKEGDFVLDPTDPFPHSQRATFFTKDKPIHDLKTRNETADRLPEGVAIFGFDAQGGPSFEALDQQKYRAWLEQAAYNEDLSYYPWYDKGRDWISWYRREYPSRLVDNTVLVTALNAELGVGINANPAALALINNSNTYVPPDQYMEFLAVDDPDPRLDFLNRNDIRPLPWAGDLIGSPVYQGIYDLVQGQHGSADAALAALARATGITASTGDVKLINFLTLTLRNSQVPIERTPR